MFVRNYIANQFRKPRGPVGALVGMIMAHRPSNRRRVTWTAGLLDIAPNDRVLEIGVGPGIGIASIAQHLTTGRVVGIDHSDVMVRQATRRNMAAIRSGRAELKLLSLNHLPEIAGGYTKAMASNVLHFQPDLAAACAAVAKMLAPGGVLAVTYQPRRRFATHDDATAFGDHLAVAFSHAGLVGIRMEELALKPAPAICVLGRRPG